MPQIAAKILLNTIKQSLGTLYPPRETEHIALQLISHLFQADRAFIAINGTLTLNKTLEKKLEKSIALLKAHVPIQYIVGSVVFYKGTFKTDKRALVPRPETEELVSWIILENQQPGSRILDIGTGTGCIAITLANELKQAWVQGVDISEDALALARENATLNKACINFLKMDILTQDIPEMYDVVVSNPPYIPEGEKTSMPENVILHEPSIALFVPEETPLMFYHRIMALAAQCLNPGGRLYFEVHEDKGREVCRTLEDKGFVYIQIKEDLQGKQRMVRAVKS